MKVTGWTEWGDSIYIDIRHENINARCELLEDVKKDFPLPSPEEVKNIPEEYLKAYFEDRDRALDAAFQKYYEENSEAEDLEEEIRRVVVSEIRDKGYHFSGDSHQGAPNCTPVIDDRYIYCVSMRDWGQIMAEAYPDEDYGKADDLRYCKWAWYNPDLQSETVFPPEN